MVPPKKFTTLLSGRMFSAYSVCLISKRLIAPQKFLQPFSAYSAFEWCCSASPVYFLRTKHCSSSTAKYCSIEQKEPEFRQCLGLKVTTARLVQPISRRNVPPSSSHYPQHHPSLLHLQSCPCSISRSAFPSNFSTTLLLQKRFQRNGGNPWRPKVPKRWDQSYEKYRLCN